MRNHIRGIRSPNLNCHFSGDPTDCVEEIVDLSDWSRKLVKCNRFVWAIRYLLRQHVVSGCQRTATFVRIEEVGAFQCVSGQNLQCQMAEFVNLNVENSLARFIHF